VSPKLQKGEEMIRALRPHPLAFYRLYGVWIYLSLVGVYFSSGSTVTIYDMTPETSARILWWLSILVPAVLIALFRINWRWLFALGAPAVIAFSLPGQPEYIDLIEGFGLDWFMDQNHILTTFGILGVLGTRRIGGLNTATTSPLEADHGVGPPGGSTGGPSIYKNINDQVVEQSFPRKGIQLRDDHPNHRLGPRPRRRLSMVGAAWAGGRW
jgi:hypothetical protein